MAEKYLAGVLLDDRIEISLDELSGLCACHADWILELVEEGVIEPLGRGPGEWRFTGVSVTRVHTALRLHRDLDLNVAGVALAMDLLDEIADLKARLRLLEP